MKQIKGIIHRVRKGEITILLKSGTKLKFKTGGDFEFGEMVLVLYDHGCFRVKDVVRPKDFNTTDKPAPKCAPLKKGAPEKHPVDEEQEKECSFPLPDGRLEEFFLEGEV